MTLSGILKTFINSGLVEQTKLGSLKPGQIVEAKITKLFPNHTAEVQAGSQKLIAKLEIPLSAGERYWFQVLPGDGKVNLKLLVDASSEGNEIEGNTENLLMHIGLPKTKENSEFVKMVLKEQLPIPAETIPHAARLIEVAPSRNEAMKTIQLMAERNLPFTKDIFLSLNSLQSKSQIHELLGEVLQSIDSSPETKTAPLLKQMLQSFMQSCDSELLAKGDVNAGKHLKSLISSLGFGFEKDLFEKNSFDFLNEDKQTIKSLLLHYLKEQPDSGKETPSEHLLHKMNGMQLLSQDSGPVMQFFTQLPVTFSNYSTDLTIQWNGRKLENGKIDPNYCRVLFYLHLKSIGDTLVDMQVQNRILTLSISSEREDLKGIASPFVSLLKEKLKQLDYHLSSIGFHNETEEKENYTARKNASLSVYGQKIYEGVDFRI